MIRHDAMLLWTFLVSYVTAVSLAREQAGSCLASSYLSAEGHPQSYLNTFTAAANRSFVPFIGLLDTNCEPKSSFTMWEHDAAPDSSGWGLCRQCVLHDQHTVKVFQTDLETTTSTVLSSWSQWNEFFYAEGNDLFRLVGADKSAHALPRYVVDLPVYVLPIIAFHPGHFLIDVYEQLFTSMIKHYGQVRRDSIVIIDVAAPHQRPYYHKYLLSFINEGALLENIYSLMHSFTDFPVLTHHVLDDILSIEGGVLFTDLHLAGNNHESHYYRGYKYHPFPFDVASEQSRVDNYQLFQQHVQNYTLTHQSSYVRSFWKDKSSQVKRKTLVVTKAKNRVISNQPQVVESLQSLNCSVIVEDLGVLSLQEQISIFSELDIFVAVAGTAVHNALFMKPSAIVVVVMQPLWCHYSWMYINQLRLLGLRYVVICSSSVEFNHDAHLHDQLHNGDFYLGVYRKSWKQGPRITKLHSIELDTKLLESRLIELFTQVPIENNDTVLTSDRQNSEISSDSSTAVQLIVSTIEFPEDDRDSESVQIGQLKIWYDFVGEWDNVASLLQASDELSICNIMPLAGERDAICFPLDSMNYFSGLKMMMDGSVQQTALLQLWIQLSSDGGKVHHSDVFIPIDNRLRPGGGMAIQDWCVGKKIQFGLAILSYNSDGNRLQGLIVNTIQYSLYLKYLSKLTLPIDQNSEQLLLEVHMHDRYTLQRWLPAFCRQHRLLDANCGLLVQSLYRYLHQWQVIEQLQLPAVQHSPSPSNPFVFLHVDKTGGTTLRDFIANSTTRLNASYFIPCYNNVSCMTFDIEKNDQGRSDYSALAGHFFWDIWKTLPADQTDQNIIQPSCFVMTRHPVQRIISLYNQRYFSELQSAYHQRPIDTFSAEEWERILIYQRFARKKEDNVTVIIVDEGMSDAACRAILNLRATTGLVNPSSIEVPPELTAKETQQAINNVKQCVVGVLEEWEDTVRVINHWFPWISFDNKFGRQLNRGNKGDKYLRKELMEVTIRNNPCDMALHQAMLEQFELQKKVINLEILDDS